MLLTAKFPPLQLCPPRLNLNTTFPKPSLSPRRTFTIQCSKRTGKHRYPSEKKKLRRLKDALTQTEIKSREEGFWRIFKLGVPVSKDPGKDFMDVSPPLLQAIAKVLKFPVAAMLPQEAFSVLRKSFDARKVLKEAEFVYTVDMDVKKLLNLEPRAWDFVLRLEPKLGLVEYMSNEKTATDLISILHDSKRSQTSLQVKEDGHDNHIKSSYNFSGPEKPKVAVVGSGPSGLFASLVLAELGAEVTLIERGQAVEQRGRDIGALVVRRALQPESNFCFGEDHDYAQPKGKTCPQDNSLAPGQMTNASYQEFQCVSMQNPSITFGTWSDGKLVTRIGRNSDSVRTIMKTLVHFGAPPSILVDGKPHLGTDRLIPLLRNFRQHLEGLGVNIRFGTRMNDLIVGDRQVLGVKVSESRHDSDNQNLLYDAIVLAVGHSARDVYKVLLQHNVELVPKDFAVGLRIEHPQQLIDSIQYSALAMEVRKGRGKVPVADYKVVKYTSEGINRLSCSSMDSTRSCYSFCMCPGGQVVLTSTDPTELCINGMSFSRRASRWANAALVVTVSSSDFDSFQGHGPLCGVEFQRELERRAAIMGGGNFVVPAQTVTDFLDNKLSDISLPSSSYRMGVRASNLHDLFPANITQALQHSISMFEKELPGFISKDALLHGVETRTSSPVQILRHTDTYESTSLRGLYPIGEGAGYAGGIVSAAVDGMYCGFALAKSLNLYEGDIESIVGKAQRNTGFVKY